MRHHRFPPAGRNGHNAAQHPAAGGAAAPEIAVDPGAGGPNDQTQTPGTDPLQLLLRQFRELGEYFSYYLSARADSARLGLQNALLNLTLAALAIVVVASLSIAAIWFVLNGAAEGLSVLCGNRPWAGSLLTGSLLAAGLGGGMWCIVIGFKKTARERTVARYENRNARQHARYGHNVADRAVANGPDANGPTANGPDANNREPQ